MKQLIVKIKGYVFYRTTHPNDSAAGKSVVIIKEHFRGESNQTEEIHVISVTIYINKYSIVVAIIYCAPRHALIGSDFNAKNEIWDLG